MQSRGRSGPGRLRTVPEPNLGGSTSSAGESGDSHSLRRSARLAGLLARRQQGSSSARNIEPSHASRSGDIESSPQQFEEGPQRVSEVTQNSEIASRDTLSGGTVEHTVETTRSLTLAEDDIDNRNHRFVMNVVVEPPSEIRPGDLLHPPIVIKLKNRGGGSADDEFDIDNGSLWAQASVVSEDGMVALAPPQPNLISGTLVDSIRPATPEEESQELGYLTFPNLAIHQTGKFRIRISLIKMPTTDESEAINLQSIVTRIIKVDSDANTPSIGNPFYPFTVSR